MREVHQRVFEGIVREEVNRAISHTGPSTDFSQWFKDLNERLESLSKEYVHTRQILPPRQEH